MATATTSDRRIDRLFEALLHRQEAIFDAIERDNERRHRLRSNIIEAMQRGGHDWVGVTRRWAERPMDLAALYRGAAAAAGNGRDRTGALVQEWLEDVLQPARERTTRPRGSSASRPRRDTRTPETDASRQG